MEGDARNKWYNITLGLALIGVACTPHRDYTIAHYAFAGYYFFGGVFYIIYYSSVKQRWYKIIAGAVVCSALLLSAFNVYSLFWGEWIALPILSIHYLGEYFGKLD